MTTNSRANNVPTPEKQMICAQIYKHCMAVSWLSWLAARLSMQKPGFNSMLTHGGLGVDKVAMGQISLLVFPFSQLISSR
jgi:hypothetical protein